MKAEFYVKIFFSSSKKKKKKINLFGAASVDLIRRDSIFAKNRAFPRWSAVSRSSERYPGCVALR